MTTYLDGSGHELKSERVLNESSLDKVPSIANLLRVMAEDIEYIGFSMNANSSFASEEMRRQESLINALYDRIAAIADRMDRLEEKS